MLLVPTYLATSSIAGIGLFALQYIPKGTVIWRLHPPIDVVLDALPWGIPEVVYRRLMVYAYTSKTTGKLVLCGDDARFLNHSSNPNCEDVAGDNEGYVAALQDIFSGEELTSNYAAFDACFEQYASTLR